MGDPNRDECFMAAIQAIISSEILDPFTYDSFEIQVPPNAFIKGSIQLSNIVFTGISRTNILKMKTDFKNGKFSFGGNGLNPQLTFKSDTKNDLFDGTIEVNLIGIELRVKVDGHIIQKDGDDYVVIDALKTLYDLKDLKLSVSNLKKPSPLGKRTLSYIYQYTN